MEPAHLSEHSFWLFVLRFTNAAFEVPNMAAPGERDASIPSWLPTCPMLIFS